MRRVAWLTVVSSLVAVAFTAASACSKAEGDPVDGGTDAAGEVDAPPAHECPPPAMREPVEITCDGVDNDCNGTIDDVANPPPWYRDGDGDGVGGGAAARFQCGQPDGFTSTDGDCNDGDPTVLPGHAEWCDGVDNDCDPGTGENCGTAQCTPLVRDGHRYLVCKAKQNWATARATCEANGFQLAKMDDDAENTWLRTNANPIESGQLWLGGTDQGTEDMWLWTDGIQFWQGRANGGAVDGHFAKWSNGEPNNDNEEDCLELVGDGRWNDRRCTDSNAFACERY